MNAPPPPSRPDRLSRRAVLAQAWPIIVGQASIPLVGLADVAVIGRTGESTALAGVALGATVIGMIFWAFGFLRMGMTGLTAQAQGAGEDGSGARDEIDLLLLRALIIGGGIGMLLLVLRAPLSDIAFSLMAGGEDISAEARAYVGARFLGAPAALCGFAINGWLLGLGRTRDALVLQIFVNCINLALDIGFVWGLDMGARGVGLGTAGAEWLALIAGLTITTRIAGRSPLAIARAAGRAAMLERAALLRMFAVNRDLMIRTVALLLMFTWFANAGARLGSEALAANHVLLQFINIAAFVLDAFAFTAEARVGHAIGARSRAGFLRAIRLTGEFSFLSGLLLALIFLTMGQVLIDLLTTDPTVRAEAARFLPFAALVPLIGMPGWLLDGIFIGATRGQALRNSAVIATAIYLLIDLALRPHGNIGVWIAISASYLLRAGTLAWHFPALLRSVEPVTPVAENRNR